MGGGDGLVGSRGRVKNSNRLGATAGPMGPIFFEYSFSHAAGTLSVFVPRPRTGHVEDRANARSLERIVP